MTVVGFNKRMYHLNGAMESWCKEHVGPGGWLNAPEDLWTISSVFGNTTFTFKYERDATLFALKWK